LKGLCANDFGVGYHQQFDQLQYELFVAGSDFDTGEQLIFGAGEYRDSHICRMVAASCAIPFFFRPIRIGHRDVVDSGVSEASPIDIAVRKGATEILFVNPMLPILNDRSRICIPASQGNCARLSEKGVGWIGEQATRLMRAKCPESAIDTLQLINPEASLIRIEPSRIAMHLFMHNMTSFSASRELLACGRECGRRHFFASSDAAIPPFRRYRERINGGRRSL
jgi:predicted acylesterase/phospholipase RssA